MNSKRVSILRQCLLPSVWVALTIFLNIIFQTISSFCEGTDTSVLDYWWRLLWVSKPGWNSLLRALSPGALFLRHRFYGSLSQCEQTLISAIIFTVFFVCFVNRQLGFWCKLVIGNTERKKVKEFAPPGTSVNRRDRRVNVWEKSLIVTFGMDNNSLVGLKSVFFSK